MAGMQIPRKPIPDDPAQWGERDAQSLERAFQYNLKQLKPNDPLRVQIEKSLASQKAPGRQYKGFWDELGRSLAAGTLKVGSGLAGTLASASESAIFDKQQIEDIAEKLYEMSQSEKLSPGEGGGVKGFVAQAVGRTFPFMVAATAATMATGTPLAAFGVGYAVEGDGAYRDALANGATEEQARMEGFVVGTINGAIEQMQVGGILPGTDRGLKCRPRIRRRFKRSDDEAGQRRERPLHDPVETVRHRYKMGHCTFWRGRRRDRRSRRRRPHCLCQDASHERQHYKVLPGCISIRARNRCLLPCLGLRRQHREFPRLVHAKCAGRGLPLGAADDS